MSLSTASGATGTFWYVPVERMAARGILVKDFVEERG